MVRSAGSASKISLVVADVDGTLVTEEKVLTSRAAAATKALQTAGIAFAITSGRPAPRHVHVGRSIGVANSDRRIQRWYIRKSLYDHFGTARAYG